MELTRTGDLYDRPASRSARVAVLILRLVLTLEMCHIVITSWGASHSITET